MKSRIAHVHWAASCSGNLYSESARSRPGPGYRVSCLRVFVAFVSILNRDGVLNMVTTVFKIQIFSRQQSHSSLSTENASVNNIRISSQTSILSV
jgi:hypothetical protein